jgi:hypothetical protein
MTKDEALDLALEALESVLANHNGAPVMPWIEARDAIKQARALDKKAENARELGLDYEPVPENFIDALKFDVAMRDAAPVQEPVAWLHPANATCVTTDPTAYARGIPLYTTPPAQPAPVQEPVAIPEYIRDAAKHLHENRFEPSFIIRAIVGWINGSPPAAAVLEGRDWSLLEATQESLREHMAEIKRLKAAQPAVPDAIIEAGESPEFRDGWNECRETMLQMLK